MVSVIIVNFNGEKLIHECLIALQKQTHADFEIIIVDNGSSDNTLKVIHQFLKKTSIKFPVKIIPITRNLGFSGGNAEGLRHASGNYIALLNNDTEPDEKWLSELASHMDSDSKVGVCASKLLVFNSDQIDSAGDGYTRMLKGLGCRTEGKNHLHIFDHPRGAEGPRF